MASCQKSRTAVLAKSKLFPTKIETEQQSLLFVKKLLTVAVSNITYLRSMFPEEAYADRKLDGMGLKVLKEKSSHPGARTLAGWLVGTFDALERKYLRELKMVIYEDEEMKVSRELYSFSFSYPGGVVTCQMNNEGSTGVEPTLVSSSNILAATQALLRKLVVLMQGLAPLPPNSYVAMITTYHDDATPQDYEPQGFIACNYSEIEDLGAHLDSVEVGEVGSKHHKVLLQVKAPAHTEPRSTVSSQQPVLVNDQYGCSESENDARRSEAPTVTNNANEVSDGLENMDINEEERENPVDCVCLLSSRSGLLLSCSICGKLSHGACYRVLDGGEISNHYCLSCSISDTSVKCTDAKLPKMFEKNSAAVPLTCVFRRILASLRERVFVEVPSFWSEIGIVEETEGFLNRLLEGRALEPTEIDGKFNVIKDILEELLQRYLGIKTKRNKRSGDEEDLGRKLSKKAKSSKSKDVLNV